MTRTWLILIAALMAGHKIGGLEAAFYNYYGPGRSITVQSIAAPVVDATYSAIVGSYELVTGLSGREYPGTKLISPACKRVLDYLYWFESDLAERIEDPREASDNNNILRLEEELRFIQEGPDEWRPPVSLIPEIRVSPWVWGNCVFGGGPSIFFYENCLAYGVNAADLEKCMVDIRPPAFR
jgi:hypothetical protein